MSEWPDLTEQRRRLDRRPEDPESSDRRVRRVRVPVPRDVDARSARGSVGGLPGVTGVEVDPDGAGLTVTVRGDMVSDDELRTAAERPMPGATG